MGHQLPRQLTTGAAAVPLRADSKVAERRGRDGPILLQKSAHPGRDAQPLSSPLSGVQQPRL